MTGWQSVPPLASVSRAPIIPIFFIQFCYLSTRRPSGSLVLSPPFSNCFLLPILPFRASAQSDGLQGFWDCWYAAELRGTMLFRSMTRRWGHRKSLKDSLTLQLYSVVTHTWTHFSHPQCWKKKKWLTHTHTLPGSTVGVWFLSLRGKCLLPEVHHAERDVLDLLHML